MLKKCSVCLLSVCLLINGLIVNAQQSPTFKVKFELNDFKNPSFAVDRYGLIEFNRDDKKLAVKGTNFSIVVYDTETGDVLYKLTPDGRDSDGFEFSLNEKNVLLQDTATSTVRVWNVGKNILVHKIESLGFISNIKRRGANSNKRTRTEERDGKEAQELQVSADGSSLLIAKNDHAYQVVDLATGEIRFEVEQFSRSNYTKELLSSYFRMYLFDRRTRAYISNARYNSDGSRIILANGDKVPTLWDAQTGKLIARLEPHETQVYTVSFSANGKLAATIDVDGIIRIWNASNGELLSAFGTKEKKAFVAEWSPTAELLAVSIENNVEFYTARTGKIASTIKKPKARRVAFSPDGSRVFTFSKDDKTSFGKIWNVADGQLIGVVPRRAEEERAYSLDWSPNGRILVISSQESVNVFDQSGKFLQRLGTAVFPARFSHDGKLLATGGKNDVGFLWQIAE